MLYESEPIQFRHTFRLWNQTEIHASDSNKGRGISSDQGMVLAQIWLYTEICNSKGWQDNSRGFIV